ncbi:MAG: adenylate/guanylate cyclase domain-containing protein [Spirochaetaceae bacterium]|nr:MAG: adenylate/guanylate cyclase domain-containing protein [Spirochaetaceae bacterium]
MATRKQRYTRAIVIGLSVMVFALVIVLSGAFEGAELASWDWRTQLFAGSVGGQEVIIIEVSESDLEFVEEEFAQSWPWPRVFYGAITDFMARAGVSSLTFDVLFIDPSRAGVWDDEDFADALRSQERNVMAVALGTESGRTDQWPDFLRARGTPVTEELRSEIRSFARASFPQEEIAEASGILSNVVIASDRDGVYRRAQPYYRFDDRMLPAPAIAAWSLEAGALELPVFSRRSLSISGTDIPLDADGNMVVRFDRRTQDRTRLSAAAVIQSELLLREDDEPVIAPEELAGAHVIVGLTAPGLFDQRPLPIGGQTSGVEFHAAMLENILNRSFVRVPPAALTAVYAVLLGGAASVLTTFGATALWSVISLVLWTVVPVVVSLVAFLSGIWIPVVIPVTVSFVGALAAGGANYATEGKERRFIRNAFSQYLSPAVIERLVADPDRLKLGGERREITIFFSDLQGFTSLSEGLTPDALTALLNDYLSEMTDIIQEEGGTVDKYEGDAIIAFWNAPMDIPDHPVCGVRAALRCQERLAELRPVFRERSGTDLLMRIGMNTGAAIVGNLGSRTRFDYTMLGDAVNLGARLEGVNKQFGTYTMISEMTARQLRDEFALRELGKVGVVGRAEAVRIFQPMRHEVYENGRTGYETFARALQAYYAGDFRDAAKLFASLPDDPPAVSYTGRCEALMNDPPEPWNGVWVMDSK